VPFFYKNNRPFIIAEIGINHSGNVDVAERMIESAAKAGADAVKFQTFIPELLYSTYTKSLLETGAETSADNGIIDFFRTFVLSPDDHFRLKKCADSNGVHFLSAPFDIPSFELLEKVGVSAYKIASSEVTNIPLLEKIASTGKPVAMSTGMSHKHEIDNVVNILKNGGCEVTLLHCVALYPVPETEVNLSRIETLKKEFGLPVGFSDHSPDIEYAKTAAAMGAAVIEKHFTLSRDFECPDGNVSVTPEQLTCLIEETARIFTLRGNGEISYGKEEEKLAKCSRRSLYAAERILQGSVLERGNIVIKRPGMGMPVYELDSVLGKKALRDIPADARIMKEDFN
jgi:N,N'-diacetyllegionaminate synthase